MLGAPPLWDRLRLFKEWFQLLEQIHDVTHPLVGLCSGHLFGWQDCLTVLPENIVMGSSK